jgi:tetratricopeptide (TPR) repeat protein
VNPKPDQPLAGDSSSATGAAFGAAQPVRRAPVAAEIESLERAWTAPARRLEERVSRTRAVADELGVGSLDPLARALLLDTGEGTPLERAAGAVALAPDLPAAHWALARAGWQSGAGIMRVLAAGWNAVVALPEHLEASLWLGATASVLAFVALLAAGLAFIAGRGLAALPHAAHDLADRIEPTMPGHARVASVAVAVLLLAALGEGLLGAALGLFGLAMLYADAAERRALAIAAALVVVALHPLAQLAGRELAALGSDPVAESTWAAEGGFVDPVALGRLERADGSDPLANHALALRARRAGDLADADARYAALLAAQPHDVVVLNNAANVRLALGDTSGAIDLYRRATAEKASALIWFNLSQAHGRAIQVEEHERALAAAQAIDPEAVGDLTRRLSDANANLTAELPLPLERIRARLARADGGPAAAELRRPLAPGLLGRTALPPAIAFAALGTLALAMATRFERSRTCAECGTRLCRRCGSAGGSHGLCAGCARRRLDAHHGGPWEGGRAEAGSALAALVARASRVAERVLPGVVGRAPRRPAQALAALVAGAAATAAWIGRHGIVSDPASVGGAGPFAFGCAAAALGALYVALAAAAGAGGRR